MPFLRSPPELGNHYTSDHALAALRRFRVAPINLIANIDHGDSNMLLAGD